MLNNCTTFWKQWQFLNGLDICKNFSRHSKGQADVQMDGPSASSETSYHGLPSKSKRPSIRKHSVLVSSELIILVFMKQPSAERYLANIFLPVFLWTFRNSKQRIKIHSERFQKVDKNTPVTKSFLVKLQSSVLRKVFEKFTGTGLCQRLSFNKVAILRL